MSEHQNFNTTHWSMVLAAGGNDTVAQNAMGTLCQRYWYPLYCFVRYKGHSVEESEDFLQSFFLFLCEKEIIQKARKERGRFRSFLMKSLQNFIQHQISHQKAKKRGGGKQIVSLDINTAEEYYQLEPVDNMSPDILFMKSWATTLIDNSVESLRKKYQEAGKGELFETLLPNLLGDSQSLKYNEIAEKIDQTENAVKQHVKRIRTRFKDQLKNEIMQTVDESVNLDEEIADLFKILST